MPPSTNTLTFTFSASSMTSVCREEFWLPFGFTLLYQCSRALTQNRNIIYLVTAKYYFEWCGQRPSVLGQDWSQTRKSVLVLVLHAVVLVLQIWCGVVKTRSCNARRHNDLEGHSSFSSTIWFLYSVLGTSLLLKLNLPSAFVYLQWSWSCFGLGLVSSGLGLKNLVLFTSLIIFVFSCTYTVWLIQAASSYIWTSQESQFWIVQTDWTLECW